MADLGKFNFIDGRVYTGDWLNNSMDGKGVFKWGNECKYTGEYKNNKREGNGVYSFGCNLYDGYWLNNMPHGEGTLLLDGIRIVGLFRYGKILEMKEGKGANREMTQRFTLDSTVINKSLDDTKGLDKSLDRSNDSRTIKYASVSGCKKKESKINTSKYSKSYKKCKSSRKKKSKDKEKSKEKEKSKDKKKKK